MMSWKDKTLFSLFIFFGIYKPNFCHTDFSSIELRVLLNWPSIEAESFRPNHPFCFSNFLITISSPNFSFKIWSALPIPSIKPILRADAPVQNSPVKILFFSGSFNFAPLLVSTTFMKSAWSSNWIFLSLSISSNFSSWNGSYRAVIFPAVCTLLSTPIFFINSVNPKDE